jgi:hypothetical protein
VWRRLLFTDEPPCRALADRLIASSAPIARDALEDGALLAALVARAPRPGGDGGALALRLLDYARAAERAAAGALALSDGGPAAVAAPGAAAAAVTAAAPGAELPDAKLEADEFEETWQAIKVSHFNKERSSGWRVDME